MYQRANLYISEIFFDNTDIVQAQKDFHSQVSRVDFSVALKKILLRAKLEGTPQGNP